jgi:hypothetical protein
MCAESKFNSWAGFAVLLVVLILITFFGQGCAHSQYSTDRCDAVSNREDEWVVGKDRVMKKCRPVADHPGCVCDPL